MKTGPVVLTIVAGLASIVCIIPFYFTGALAVQLREDLGFGPLALGIAVAMFHASAGVVAIRMGRLTDQLGSIVTLRVAVVVTCITLLGISVTAYSWAALIAWLILGGAGFALAQPAANRVLVMGVSPRRLGIAFGVKQSAAPLATVVAGLSVPLLALTLGWRWAYGAGAAMALIILLVTLTLPRTRARGRKRQNEQSSPLRSDRNTFLLAVSFGLSVGAASTVTTFYVDATAQTASPPELAATLLAGASGIAIGVRLVSGYMSDRMSSGHLRMCGVGLAVGSIGILMLAIGGPFLASVGVIVALAGTWGFNGVFWYALMRASPVAPGAMTGLVTPGGVVGAMTVPASFGALAEHSSYTLAWIFAATVAVAGAFAMLASARVLDRLANAG